MAMVTRFPRVPTQPAPPAPPAPPADPGPVIFAPKSPPAAAPAPAPSPFSGFALGRPPRMAPPVAFGPAAPAAAAPSAPARPATKAPLFQLPTPASILQGPDAIVRSYAQHVAPYKSGGLGGIGGIHIEATDFGGVNPEDYGQDDQLIQGIKSKAATLIQNTSLAGDVNQIWAGAEAGLAVGAAIGLTVSIIAAALSAASFTALSAILSALVGAIATAITNAMVAAGIATFTTAVVAGGSFGYVGAIIGAVIGACIAIGNILTGGQHVQIEDGRTFSCSDYVSKNMQAASDFLAKANLIGVTPLWVARTFGLFIANPTWLYLNQDKFPGHGQPPPPDPGSGDPLDMVYSQLPGAFEMLNRAQLAAASGLMMSTSQKGDFYASIPTPGNVTPDPVNENYKGMTANTPLAWALGNPYWGGYINGVFCNDGFQYAACPNLWTNDCQVEGDLTHGGKVHAQTALCPGIYAIQVLYPSLLKSQAEKLFTQANRQSNDLQLSNAMAGDLSSLVQNSSPGGSVNTTGGQVDGAPLPTNTHPGVSAPPAAPPPPQLGVSGMSGFGPNMAGLAASLAGMSGSSWFGGWSPPTTPLTPAEIQQMDAASAAAQAAAAKLLANPPKVWPKPAPLTPVQAVALFGTAAAAKIAGMVPTPAMAAAAAATVASTVAQANQGHPVAVQNAKLLDMAQRLSIQASWVSKYFGGPAAATILAANPAALQVGTGKYDRNLPLILEQTVDAALADPQRTKAGLTQLATALYQLP